MGRVSGGAAVSALSLLRLGIAPDRRLPHRVAALGDSRVAAIHADPAHRVLSNRSPLNWANARIGQRLTLDGAFGGSGDRTDQIANRIEAAIATGAGLLYLQGGLNDIAQRWPTATGSGAAAATNLIAMADLARASGMIIVIEAEVGSNNLDSGQVGQIIELNARLTQYAESTAGVHLHDARAAVLDPVAGDAATLYRAGLSYDGVHPSGRGALAWSDSLATLFRALVPTGPSPLIVNRHELPENARRQLVRNPVMIVATGGSGGAGGPVPGGYVVEQLGGATAQMTTRQDPDGLGNNAIVDATFSATGQRVLIKQDILSSNYVVGDVVQAFASVELLTTPTALSGLYLNLNQWTGSEGFDVMAMHGADPVGPDRAMALTLCTPRFVIRPTTGGWLTVMVGAASGGSGSARFAVRQIGLRRVG